MCWGFSHGDGWFPIIKGLSLMIQGRINHRLRSIEQDTEWNEKIATGWKPSWMKEGEVPTPRPVEEPIPQVVVEQVKEKFGTLRFYYRGGDDAISHYVEMAEAMSGVICERCGAPAETQSEGGWVSTQCQTCRDKPRFGEGEHDE
jgi:hypothetical protein